jgi:hypothetical protein
MTMVRARRSGFRNPVGASEFSSRSALELNPPPVQLVTESFPGGKAVEA